jgi:hypothetical protein
MKMKKIAPFLIVAILTACPYKSRVPLSDFRKSVIDRTIIGEWTGDRQGDMPDVGLKIIRFNENEYFIELSGFEHGKPVVERMRGFISLLDGGKILNIHSLEGEEGFYFLRYRIEGNDLKMALATDSLLKMDFRTIKELKKFFEKNMGKKDFFDKDMVFHKKEKTAEGKQG